MKIKINDNVKVLIGKDKNRQGIVTKIFPKKSLVLVSGINISKKHLKSSQGKPGGIVDKEVPIHVSKLALFCPICKQISRVGYIIQSDKKKVRTCKKCKAILDSKSLVEKTTNKKKDVKPIKSKK